MSNTAFLVLSIVANAVIYWTFASWYLQPWLARQPIAKALAPLALVHGLRTMGTVFLMPNVIGSELPRTFAVSGVVGDLVAAGLGGVVVLALRARSRWAIPLTWLLQIAGLLDFASAYTNGMRIDLVAQYHVGPAWFIPSFCVPFFAVMHLLSLRLLVTRGAELRAWLTGDTRTSATEVAIAST